MMRTLPVLCGLVVLAGCASDDSTPVRHHDKYGKYYRSGIPKPSSTPGQRSVYPVSVPPGTVTNSPALHQGAVDAMGDPANGD